MGSEVGRGHFPEQDKDDRAVSLDDDAARRVAPTGLPRNSRRLSDKVLVAFHHACDTSDLVIAAHLLKTLEIILSRRPTEADSNRRRNIESLVAAHERLWLLRNPAVD